MEKKKETARHVSIRIIFLSKFLFFWLWPKIRSSVGEFVVFLLLFSPEKYIVPHEVISYVLNRQRAGQKSFSSGGGI